jgi:diguanylate cyclase (GGDEF)-like protein
MLQKLKRNGVASLYIILVLVALYFISFYDYLLFHILAEFFSIVVAFTVFMLTWNSKKYMSTSYLTCIGISYLFIGILDLLHTIGYKGMDIFKDYDYYANQLWVAARYMESLTLLFAFIFLNKKKKIDEYWIMGVYTVLTLLAGLSIFYWKIFPICFVEGQGQTLFKQVSEYIINTILLSALLLLRKNKHNFEIRVYGYLFWSIIFTMISEFAFTIYISNYGFSNLVGHYFKIFSFYFIYKAVIVTGITMPYDLIFRELTLKGKELEKQAEIDYFTGVFNRRAAFNILEKTLKLASHNRSSTVLCYIDIDGLKKVNDFYGHAEGDAMLKTIVDKITECIREMDYLCRIGGDEFLLILPECTTYEGAKIIQQTKMELSYYDQQNIKGYKTDFSYGFAQYDGEDKVNIDKLIEEADSSMYKNKLEKKGM